MFDFKVSPLGYSFMYIGDGAFYRVEFTEWAVYVDVIRDCVWTADSSTTWLLPQE